MKILLSLMTTLCLSSAVAAPVVLDLDTPLIIPANHIYTFEPIDWYDVEEKQDKGQSVEDWVVMMCDDSYYSVVEIQLTEGLDQTVKIDSEGCPLRGANHDGQWSPAWLQFEGPEDGNECTITVSKERPGKTPLVVNYGLADAC